jgi:hypothetical protein
MFELKLCVSNCQQWRQSSKYEHANRNEDYKRLVMELPESELGCVVEILQLVSPIVICCCTWRVLITSLQSWAGMDNSQQPTYVTTKRGWGHALYDFLNGELKLGDLSFWNVETQEYMDWSQVDYQPPVKE